MTSRHAIFDAQARPCRLDRRHQQRRDVVSDKILRQSFDIDKQRDFALWVVKAQAD
jgi:hypothetical protein